MFQEVYGISAVYFISCSANEAEKEKGNKDSQIKRDEDAESEDCPPDGLPKTIARKLLQGDNGQQRENRFIIVVFSISILSYNSMLSSRRLTLRTLKPDSTNSDKAMSRKNNLNGGK